jgi:hypothetical protein
MCKDLTNIQNMVFSMKKPLYDGVDLTSGRRGGRSDASGMWAILVDLCCRKPVSTGEGVNANIYKELFLKQHMVPWVQRTYPGGKYVF